MRDSMAGVDCQKDKIAKQIRRKVCQKNDGGVSENERELESLEYEEDVYYSKPTTTPSFDDIDELDDEVEELIVHCWRDCNGEIEEIVVDDGNLSIEMEQEGNGSRGRRKRRSIRVIFQDISKAYLVRIINSQNYKKFLELVKGADRKEKRNQFTAFTT